MLNKHGGFFIAFYGLNMLFKPYFKLCSQTPSVYALPLI
jgi:hypothetical protein